MLDNQLSIYPITESGPFPRPTKMGMRREGCKQVPTSGFCPIATKVFIHPIENEFADAKPARAVIRTARNIVFSTDIIKPVQRCEGEWLRCQIRRNLACWLDVFILS